MSWFSIKNKCQGRQSRQFLMASIPPTAPVTLLDLGLLETHVGRGLQVLLGEKRITGIRSTYSVASDAAILREDIPTREEIELSFGPSREDRCPSPSDTRCARRTVRLRPSECPDGLYGRDRLTRSEPRGLACHPWLDGRRVGAASLNSCPSSPRLWRAASFRSSRALFGSRRRLTERGLAHRITEVDTCSERAPGGAIIGS